MVDINNINSINYKLESTESQNVSLRKALDKRGQDQGNILNDLWLNLNNKEWDQSIKNIGKLTENSEQVLQMMKDQNTITQDTLSLTRDILKLLEDSHENKEILRYRDWVTDLIFEINQKLAKLKNVNGPVAWNAIAHAFSIKIKRKKTDFIPDAREYIELLKNILDEVNITLEEFELLMKFKWKGNDEFHTDEFQTEEEALEELERFSCPKHLQCFMDPLKKAISAVKIWRAPF
jgi:hypothetical protein